MGGYNRLRRLDGGGGLGGEVGRLLALGLVHLVAHTLVDLDWSVGWSFGWLVAVAVGMGRLVGWLRLV